MSRVLPLVLCLFALAACNSEDAPPIAPAPETAVETVPTAEPGTVQEAEVSAPLAPEPAAVATEGATPEATPGPPPGHPSGGLTVLNATGMTIVAFHMVACGESEGEPWETMREWTYNYIDAPLAPEASVEIEISAECLVTLPVWEDGTEIMEKIRPEGGMTHAITFG